MFTKGFLWEWCMPFTFAFIYSCESEITVQSKSFQRILSIFGQLSPSGARQLSFNSLQPHTHMCSTEDGRSGKDDMLRQSVMLRFLRLEKHIRFVGREIIWQWKNVRVLTDVKFADSSNEKNSSLQFWRVRHDGTLKPSAESMWLSIIRLLTYSDFCTRNCEMHFPSSFGTSVKCT